MKTSSIKILRIIARVISAIIVVFALLMFIGEELQSAKRGTSSPMTFNSFLQIAFFAIGLLGLILAWKRELIGGIISLFAFIMIFIINPDAMVLPMFIYPANAIIFIVVAYMSKVLNQKT
jgi:hypothetical protein